MERTAILNKEKNFVSCVLYLHNDGAHIRDFLNTVCGTMEEHFEKYEIVCVNDCCMDNTIEEIHRFLEESRGNHVVSMINLSFYQGVEMAMNAGRDLAVGDFLFAPETPAAFIALAGDDQAVTPENSLLYYRALMDNRVPASLHIYPEGGHGFGFSDTFRYKRQWLAELEKWLDGLR